VPATAGQVYERKPIIKKRTIRKAVSVCLLLALMISCLSMPASALSANGNFTSSLDGVERPLCVQVVDENGNPIMMPMSWPFDGTGSVTVWAGSIATIWDTGTTYFDMPYNTAIHFEVDLASPGKIEFGYTTSGGTEYTEFEGTTLSDEFSGDFRIQSSGLIYFWIKNIYHDDITVTRIHID